MGNKIQIISPPGRDIAEAKAMLESRGWDTDVEPDAFFFLHDLAPDAFFILKGWRDDPGTEAKVREIMESGVKTYWEPNPPPKLNCADFSALSGVQWQNVSRPFDEKKGRTRWQYGAEVADGYKIVNLARNCGHKVTVQISRFSKTTVVATIHADRRRTFYLKIWTANDTQARNVEEELSLVELGGMA